ncbi:MAG: MalY/PatB family protein, partial [Candidatus Aminicenantales bacterium]
AVENNGRLLVNNTLINDNGRYLMDFGSLEKSIDDRVRLLILCSPHNPVGRVWKEEELEKLVEICLEHKIIIISDEIHADLIMKGYNHIPTTTISEEAAQIVVTCTAPSKTFNIAGLEMANIIISNKFLYNQFKNAVRKAGLMHTDLFGLVATEAAYNHGEEWLQQLLDYIAGNYEFLCSFVAENMPQVKVTPLEGTYLVWLDFRSLGVSDDELKHLLLRKARVWLDDGPMFGPGGGGFQRINIACPRKILEEGLRRIAEAIK